MARVVIALLALALAVACALAIAVGPYALTLDDVGQAFARFAGYAEGMPSAAEIVLLNVRLPRIFAAILVGAALAAAGAAYQTIFRNPLVSPDILGVSTGAGLGAAAGILLSLPVVLIETLAFAGGIVTVVLVTAIAAAVQTHDRVLVLVLAGVVVGALAGAAISLVKILADPYDQLPAITFWLLGSLAGTKGVDVSAVVLPVAAGIALLWLLRWRVTILSLGDDEARALGVDVTRLRATVIAAATLATAAVVAISGVVGWIGLLIPHMARMLVGPQFGRLLPASALMGAGFLVLVDTLARTMARVETPIGILTAVIGAPVFIWLLQRTRRAWG
jgi:iron complex transport system permease protein